MKKVISVREIIIILISILVVTISTNVYATGGLSFGNNDGTISGDEYKEWQNIQEDKNGIGNNSNNSNTNNSIKNNSNTNNNTKVYNTNKNTDLPQTGIEDYNIGILLIICVGSAIFAYKKISDYKNI